MNYVSKGLRILVGFAICAGSAFPEEPNNFVYQIFVRSFADTAKDRRPAGEIGDLRGIREKLGYLDGELKAGILWLMPIFPSGTYHGYDIEDYRAVNPDYGSLQNLDDLIRAAHKRGLRIVLDIALNHTSSRHPWFREAVRDPASRFRRFYHVRVEDGSTRPRGWHVVGGARYLGSFGPNMPDLNFDEPAVRDEVKAIAKFWLDRGIDGFRLDAAKHIYELGKGEGIRKNNDWWREFSSYVYAIKPKALLVGEVLGSQEVLRRHASGLDALLDEPFLDAGRARLVTGRAGFVRQWVDALRSYRSVNGSLQSWAFLGSHDRTPRLASFLEQQVPGRVEKAYRLGMYLLFAMASFPVLYNGDELMQRGVKWRGNPPGSRDEPGDGSRIYDETLREPFPWFRARTGPPQTSWFIPRFDKANDGVSVEEQAARGGMLDVVRGLTRLRSRHPEFANGEITEIFEDSEDWIVFSKGRYLVLLNTSARASRYPVPDKWRGASVVFGQDGAVPPFGFVLLRRP